MSCKTKKIMANINTRRKYSKCIVENCDSRGKMGKTGTETFILGYCLKHYSRFKRYGDTSKTHHIIGEHRMKHPLYATYTSMKQRCYNKKVPNFPDYGGRGIKMCDRWLGINGFTNFLADMGDAPTWSNTKNSRSDWSVDRIDNNKGYSKENCKWSTRHQQAANQRNKIGVIGVKFDKSRNKWQVGLVIDKKRVLSKRFANYEDAVKARKDAELKYLGYLIN